MENKPIEAMYEKLTSESGFVKTNFDDFLTTFVVCYLMSVFQWKI